MKPPAFERSSGVLLHVSSLPSRLGIGDLGPTAFQWVDWLAEAGCRYWQVLPLGPTVLGGSPYSSLSSFAGNVSLISPDLLTDDGLLEEDEIYDVGEAETVIFAEVIKAKSELLRAAYSRLAGDLRSEFDEFCTAESEWLAPHSLFVALKTAHSGQSWTLWSRDLRGREVSALSTARRELAEEIEWESFCQFVFYRQLDELLRHARRRGVEIIGDVPLYVAPDSVDTWVNPELFTLDASTGEPNLVAGVPPDMFSESGQRWGNPLYQWEVHAADDYAWWSRRLEAFFRQADVLRIDHFTGLIRYYEIDASTDNALDGVWRDGPGAAFFEAIERRLGSLNVILEDLGPNGDVVEVVRQDLGYPGMAVVQEAFIGDADRRPSPDNVADNLVAYTGTHDNNTAVGRFEEETDKYRAKALSFTGGKAESYAWDLVSKVWTSAAVIAIAPMQDLLGLGGGARMNHPGTAEGNWVWRMPSEAVSAELAGRMASLNRISDRK